MVVPDSGIVIDCIRFLYSRGHPLKCTDPTGLTEYGPLGQILAEGQ